MKSISKKIDTLCFEIECFIEPQAGRFHAVATNVENELRIGEQSIIEVKDVRKAALYRVWHANRALDSTMRMFLEYHHVNPSGYTMGSYIHDLQSKARSGGFRQLNGNIANKIETEVVDQRNRYAHAAGAYPTKSEANYLIGQVLEAMSVVLGLKMPV